MIDLFTKPELRTLAATITGSVDAVLAVHDHHIPPTILTEVGNNATTAILAAMSEMLPVVPEVTRQVMASAIWANTTPDDNVGRAGLLSSAVRSFERVGVHGDADAALGALEERLYAAFVAVRMLRQLPAECRFAHLIVEDAHGHICTRCGERIVQ